LQVRCHRRYCHDDMDLHSWNDSGIMVMVPFRATSCQNP